MDVNPFENIFKKIERKVKRSKVQIKGRALAQQILDEHFRDHPGKVMASGFRQGVVTLEVTSSALFQEVEGFHREPLKEKFRAAGMSVDEVRAKLKST